MGATAGAIRTGRAFVELFTEDSAMMKGLRSAKKKFEAWSASIARIAAASMAGAAALATPLVAATKSWSDMATVMGDAADRTGSSISSLSELRFAAEQSGASFEDLETSLRKMNLTIADAESGSKPARQALAALGLSAEQLSKLAPDERLAKIAEALSKIGNPGRRASLALDIFGKSAAKLFPLLSLGAKGLSDLRKQASDLGLTLNDEDARAAKAFGDELAQLMMVIGRIRVHIGSALLPVIRSFVNAAIDGTKAAADWVNEHRGLAQIALAAAGGLAAVSVALTPLSALLKLGAVTAGAFAAAWSGAGRVLLATGRVVAGTSLALRAAAVSTLAAVRSVQLLSVAMHVLKATVAASTSVLLAARSAIAAMTVATMSLGPATMIASRLMRVGLISGLAAIHSAVLTTRAAVAAFPATVKTAMITARMWFLAARAAVASLQVSLLGLRIAAAMAFAVITKNPMRTLGVLVSAARGAVAGLIPMLIAVGLKIALWGLLLYGVATAAKAVFPALVSAAASAAGALKNKFADLSSGLHATFRGLSSWAGTAFGAIKDFAAQAAQDSADAWSVMQEAIAGGDWATAAKVAWAFIRLEWARGISSLQESWQAAKGWFLEIWDSLADGISLSWIELTSFLSRTWVSTVEGFKQTLASAQNWIADKIVGLMAAFDSSIDADDVRKTLQEDFDRRQKSIGGNAAAARQQADAGREQALIDWSGKDQERKQSRKSQAEKELADAAEELRRAQAEFAQVMTDGRVANKARPTPGSISSDSEGGESLSSIQKAAGPQMEGTFSNLAGRMFSPFGGGVEGTIREQLAELRKMNKKLDQVLRPQSEPQLLLRT